MAGDIRDNQLELIRKFIDDCLHTSSVKKTKAQLIYDVYVAYCVQTEQPVIGRQPFFAHFKKLFFKTEISGRKLYYCDFRPGLVLTEALPQEVAQ